MNINRILLPTDFSVCSAAATEYTKSLAEKYGSKVVVMCVVDESTIKGGWYVPHINIDDMFAEMEKEAKKQLDKCVYENFRDMESDVEKVVVKGIPDEEIIKYANDNKVDLVVMGTYSRTGTMDRVFGSTTERVIRKSAAPVLCVKVHP